MWHLCQLQHHSCFTRLSTHTAASASPVFVFHLKLLPFYQLAKSHSCISPLVLGCAHHRLWQKQLCTDFSQRAAASRVETVQLTAAAKRCFGLYSFTHQTSTNALGTPTPLRRDNCQVQKLKKLARMLCPNCSRAYSNTSKDAFGGES